MNVLHDTPIETWTDQQHAAAAKSLQDASWYALITIDKEGKIQILDGQPGAVSCHSEHCALVMLEGFAKYHREEFEGDREPRDDEDDDLP